MFWIWQKRINGSIFASYNWYLLGYREILEILIDFESTYLKALNASLESNIKHKNGNNSLWNQLIISGELSSFSFEKLKVHLIFC